jgi:phosphate/sulfate permease
MIGEGLREVGVLVFVFVPLDYFLGDNQMIPAWVVLFVTVVVGLGMWLLGFFIEEKHT